MSLSFLTFAALLAGPAFAAPHKPFFRRQYTNTSSILEITPTSTDLPSTTPLNATQNATVLLNTQTSLPNATTNGTFATLSPSPNATILLDSIVLNSAVTGSTVVRTYETVVTYAVGATSRTSTTTGTSTNVVTSSASMSPTSSPTLTPSPDVLSVEDSVVTRTFTTVLTYTMGASVQTTTVTQTSIDLVTPSASSSSASSPTVTPSPDVVEDTQSAVAKTFTTVLTYVVGGSSQTLTTTHTSAESRIASASESSSRATLTPSSDVKVLDSAVTETTITRTYLSTLTRPVGVGAAANLQTTTVTQTSLEVVTPSTSASSSPATLTPSSEAASVLEADIEASTITRTYTTTLTYAMGPSTAASSRTTTVTQTSIEVLTSGAPAATAPPATLAAEFIASNSSSMGTNATAASTTPLLQNATITAQNVSSTNVTASSTPLPLNETSSVQDVSSANATASPAPLLLNETISAQNVSSTNATTPSTPLPLNETISAQNASSMNATALSTPLPLNETITAQNASSTNVTAASRPLPLNETTTAQNVSSTNATTLSTPLPLNDTISAQNATASNVTILATPLLNETTPVQNVSSTKASSCGNVTSPPAQTQTGVVSSCSEWYVPVAGDACITVSSRFNISVEDFMAWNPSVDSPTCPAMLAGYAYCVGTCDDDALPATSTNSTSSAPLATATGTGEDVYKTYTGNGTEEAGWPAVSEWVDFDYMFDANSENMQASCAQWDVPNDSAEELANMKSAILDIADSTGVDARFILATIMQESTGCVRVITTEYSHYNPGLMQSHNGTGSCNEIDGTVQTPCPASEIYQMISDGTAGTSSGDGLEQLLAQVGGTDTSRFFRAARAYNGGINSVSDNLGTGCCTLCYASDIANRLTGWVNAPHDCTL